jgi:hypothetical protein
VARLLAAGGALRVEGNDPAAALASLVENMLSNPNRARSVSEAAIATVATAETLPGQVADALLRLLPPPDRGAAGAEARAAAGG